MEEFGNRVGELNAGLEEGRQGKGRAKKAAGDLTEDQNLKSSGRTDNAKSGIDSAAKGETRDQARWVIGRRAEGRTTGLVRLSALSSTTSLP